MFIVDSYIPTRVVFGVGRLNELATIKLPGRKALICVTEDKLMEKLGILQRVQQLLRANGVESAVFDKVTPNPLRKGVMEARDLARKNDCDFIIGLGGGSSIDTAKAVAIMMVQEGDLWEYASVGSGGNKAVVGAYPVVAISTTAGTGTETDPYSVITNEDTGEKLDFTQEAIFPVISIIDPELMLSLPRNLTIYQGFDALFHAAECYISNNNSNRMVNVYAAESVSTVAKWLPVAVADGNNLEARTNIAYAADVLSGYTQALINTTSHHIIGQTMGGFYQSFPHGATLLVIAEEYYKKVKQLRPQLLDELGEIMGIPAIPSEPGQGFVTALTLLMDKTGVRNLSMSQFGVKREDFGRIADHTVDVVGIDFEEYSITKADIVAMLEKSYR